MACRREMAPPSAHRPPSSSRELRRRVSSEVQGSAQTTSVDASRMWALSAQTSRTNTKAVAHRWSASSSSASLLPGLP